MSTMTHPNDIDSDIRTASLRPALPRPLVVTGTALAGTYVAALHGECDLDAERTLKEAFRRALASACTEIVVDLAGCTFFDSTGLSALIHLDTRIAGQPGRRFVILPGPRPVQRVFEVTALLDSLPFDFSRPLPAAMAWDGDDA